MNQVKCLTYFSVLQEYKEVTVDELSDEELLGEREYLDPEYVLQFKATTEQIGQTYNPLIDSPYLYLEMAKINSDDDLMKFVQTYGLPFSRQELPFADEVRAVSMDTIPFFRRLSLYKDTLHLWFDLQSHSEDTPFVASPYFNQVLSSKNGRNPIEAIANVLNEMKTWKESYERIDNVNIAHCVRFRTLLETAYFQLTRAVVERATLRRCSECNEVFEVAHESQKFCPPKMGRKRSTCENTHKVRKSRQKQKQKNTEE